MAEAIRLHTEVTGERPTGWYTGRTSVNTVGLAAEEGGFAYVSDTYDDDLPYWLDHDGHGNPIAPQLIIPYTLDANDMRFATPQGFNTGDQFFAYLKDSFDALYAEGKAGAPQMMSIGLHCRLVGRPGRAAALQRFIDYVKSHDKVWLPRRIDIAAPLARAPPLRRAGAAARRAWTATTSSTRFGGIFEHSPWVAERAFELELGPAHDSAGGLHNALCRAVPRGQRGRSGSACSTRIPISPASCAQAKRLTAGIDRRAGLRRARRADRRRARAASPTLNTAYVAKFGFPFIIAVQGTTKDEILAAFETRIGNDRATEFDDRLHAGRAHRAAAAARHSAGMRGNAWPARNTSPRTAATRRRPNC